MKNAFYNEEETKRKLCEFILTAQKLSMGTKCEEFEKDFATYQGRKYAVFYNSGSSANLALIQALLNSGRLKHKDRVGFSALTWATNVMPLIQLGLEPIPIDVSLTTLNVGTRELSESKEALKAFFLTNLLGLSGDIEALRKLCDEKGILLIEDNCESFGSIVNGKKLGNFGVASTFSFYVGHHLSTIEGGMVCTDDKELYDSLVMVRAHGWARSLDREKRDELKKKFNIPSFYEQYTFYTLGYNLRPMEINGFLGIEQMKYADAICRKREENFQRYQKSIGENPNVLKLDVSHMDFVSNFAFPVICRDEETFNDLVAKLQPIAEIRPIVGGNMVEQPFLQDNRWQCKNAHRIHKCGFYIPNNPDLTKEEIETLCSIISGK